MTKLKKQEIIDTLKKYKMMGIEYIDPFSLPNESRSSNILPNDLKSLEDHALNCNLCELSKKRTTFDFSNGSDSSGVLIIGTNHQLNNENIFFDLLKNMVEKVLMLKIDDVYITNILKCNCNIPYSKNSHEVDICLEYLIKQIEILKPKLIITLGDAFNSFMKSEEKIFEINGNIYEYSGIKVVPIFDLEFIYKNPSYKLTVFNDLKKIKKLLESI